jgi:Rab-GTPase-TBC domain
LQYSCDSQWCKSLKNILIAYIHRNPTTGYCQGINFIVGDLIKQLGDEEDAFWVLTMLIESVLPLDYYYSILGMMADFRVFTELANELLPELSRHLSSMKLEYSLFAFQWFVCLYCISLSKPTVLRIWDLLFLKGTKILFRVGLSILDLISKKVIGCHEYSTNII